MTRFTARFFFTFLALPSALAIGCSPVDSSSEAEETGEDVSAGEDVGTGEDVAVAEAALNDPGGIGVFFSSDGATKPALILDRTSTTASCAAGEELDPDGLCYPVCQSGFHGVGPVCWANTQ